MMDDILKQINAGEVSGVQFKERILDKYDIACELVAFSNSHGGKLVVGIKDKTGEINALSYSEVQETTNLLSDIASENVVPSILIKIDTVEVEDGNLVIATVKEGLNKPYHDNKGIVWVKNGADKRKVFDNAELAEMMTDCGSFAPDEAGVRDATVNDLDATTIKQFLGNRFERVLEKKGLTGDAFNEASLDMICSAIAKGHDCEKILRNLRFIRPDGTLTVAAMLLFGKYTQRWLLSSTRLRDFGIMRHTAMTAILRFGYQRTRMSGMTMASPEVVTSSTSQGSSSTAMSLWHKPSSYLKRLMAVSRHRFRIIKG